MTATFSCDLAGVSTPLRHVWDHSLGSGHATLALRADWQRQLRRCHRELGTRHVRFHGLLSDDMGTLVREEDRPIYSFFNADQVFDALLDIGVRPFVELSFMPDALASGRKRVFHYQANVTPPADPRRWRTLIRKFVAHLIDRYGAGDVSQWFFEVWNEPNLSAFWTGSQQDYFDLYRHTVAAIKGVDASLRVGGPATAQNAWIADFVDYCERHRLAADFISTHYYPTEALGKTDTDTLSQLAGAPPFVMRDRAKETRRLAGQRPVYYTEWNITSNPRDHLHDEPFAAALATNILMQVDPLVDGYSYWTFSGIFEENYFPSAPFQGGFGLLNLYGIPKPVYRAFELLHHLGRDRLEVIGSHPTVSAWAIREPHRVTLLLTNHAMPRHRIRSEPVHVTLTTTLPPRTAQVQRVDQDHANAYGRWIEMGKPAYLSPADVNALDRASELHRVPLAVSHADGAIDVDVTLAPHTVAAVTIDFAGAGTP